MVPAVLTPSGRPHSGLRQPDVSRVTEYYLEVQLYKILD